MSTLLSYLLALVVLSLLVFVHELGHFVVARLFGITVEVFSIGFGPEIFGWTRGTTRYRVSWVPFGGYCKLKGEFSESAPDSLYGKPPWVRILVLLAGPVANLLAAVVVMIALYGVGYSEVLPSRRVDVMEKIAEEISPAWKAGLRPGSEILSLNGKEIQNFQNIMEEVALRVNQEVETVYVLNGQTNKTYVKPILNQETGLGVIGVFPLYEAVVGAVISNRAAAKAGLKRGDRIVAVEGKTIRYYYELRSVLEHNQEKEIRLTYVRGQDTNTVSLKVESLEGRGVIGIQLSGEGEVVTNRVKSASWLLALSDGTRALWDQFLLTIRGFKSLLSGRISVSQNLYGPLRIVQTTALVTQLRDFSLLMRFVAVISLGLALANLLPIPGLDGGHVAIATVELLMRRRLDDRIRVAIESFGILVLLMLASWVLSNDIVNLLRGN
ncbi:RIP metalloprotease RseP [Thermospira aquatica]|uniref:Zinc metalloprotease n=1 Tax=Thermospira aquatica TaxID=2828656 RepID=A0AAX3BDI6_9SPIR|nr:RIP metalloprotease RseP [Thermospira aquatica]URA10378.1 RIP metalloprotease RseP [Thermospira aquatica]